MAPTVAIRNPRQRTAAKIESEEPVSETEPKKKVASTGFRFKVPADRQMPSKRRFNFGAKTKSSQSTDEPKTTSEEDTTVVQLEQEETKEQATETTVAEDANPKGEAAPGTDTQEKTKFKFKGFAKTEKTIKNPFKTADGKPKKKRFNFGAKSQTTKSDEPKSSLFSTKAKKFEFKQDKPVVAPSSKVEVEQVAVRTGEEDEEVVHELRSKVFEWVVEMEDGKEIREWAERGVGSLKLLRGENGVRVLFRTEPLGKIILNSRPNMMTIKHSAGEKKLMVTWIFGERIRKFTVRVKDAEQAALFQQSFTAAKNQ